MRLTEIAARLCPTVAALLILPLVLSAQEPGSGAGSRDTAALRRAAEARLGRNLSSGEILDLLRQSGLSRAQARTRLQQLGYDPSLADPYYDALEGGGEPPGETPSSKFVNALESMGVMSRGSRTSRFAPVDSTGFRADSLAADTLQADSLVADSLGRRSRTPELEVFGRSLFTRRTNQFAPLASGPVDAGYRLGPGDELELILTGDVQQAYALKVTREGYIVIPDVGQVLVNGLTMAQLDDVLYSRLGRVYSGVRRGGDASTHFQVSVGRVRMNQVYLVGEVTRPGAYDVSALSTVFDALYRAGGPGAHGSFRQVEIRRGGALARRVDLYNYLLHGDAGDDIRLEQGDIVFVPVAERVVRMEGAVRRPGIFELKPGEGLSDAVTFAGGLQADAVVRRIQIDRVLPPDKRRPGIDRVLQDIDLASISGGPPVALQDGDIVHVFAVSDERRHRVVLTGGVRRPGIYEWAAGMTLWQLIDRAQGLEEHAYTPRGQIYRLNPADGTRRLIHTPLLADTAGKPAVDVALADRDSIVVYDVAKLAVPEYVSIKGFVKKPGTYELARGMTLQDLVLAAGGFDRGAEASYAEVARLPATNRRTDTTAVVVRVPFEPDREKGSPGSDGLMGSTASPAGGRVPEWAPSSAEFTLEEGDRVFIRKAPGYAPMRQVRVTGEVLTPGTYVLRDEQEKLADVIARSGGLTTRAYAPGLQLYRRGSLLPTDLTRALKDPRSRYNVELEAEDSLYVPFYDPTVLVTGAVAFDSRVLFRPGKGLDYYITQAGGYGEHAARGRTSIAYANGERATVDHVLWFSRTPAVRPGSTIFVPLNPKQGAGFNWDAFLTRSLAVLSTTATLIIAVHQLK